ncbi:putative tRNA (adenine(37)-N6)-methyltransferase [Planctomycetes bacterium CA13]|uniref:Putative tRNA (Adenine(37)-N6)-methyltransferase n=1 Tax=Novipirellula herctigrandis TaxID=2527986 RepID=A0A5C5YNQ3_9BACT|nr:putative tRNA (adenine(37)-N6)-methyltransferase [Planctomycetes bacterium CA13]
MKSFRLIFATLIVTAAVASSASHAEEPSGSPVQSFVVQPIGHFYNADNRTCIIVDKKHQAGLLGLDQYSHIQVFWWFSNNDNPQKRSVLQVHPQGNRNNPLTGVFATRSPSRPNLIALTLCKIVSIKANVIEIERTDAFDGTPILDIKPFIPGYDTAEEATVATWLKTPKK